MDTVLYKWEQCVKKIQSEIENKKELLDAENLTERYGEIEEFVDRLGGVVADSEEWIRRATKVIDGYLFPISDGEWCKVLADGKSFRGFVRYLDGKALRLVIDRTIGECDINRMKVEIIRGQEGVKNRLKGNNDCNYVL